VQYPLFIFSTPKKIEAIMIAKKGNWYWPLNKDNLVPQVFGGQEGLVFNSNKQNPAHESKHANTEQPRNVTRTKAVCCRALLPFSV